MLMGKRRGMGVEKLRILSQPLAQRSVLIEEWNALSGPQSFIEEER